jgi:hypothetical protein
VDNRSRAARNPNEKIAGPAIKGAPGGVGHHALFVWNSRLQRPSAHRHELPLPTLCGSLHNPLRGPVVDPRRFGGRVDRRAVTACGQHFDHSLEGLCSHTGCDQLDKSLHDEREDARTAEQRAELHAKLSAMLYGIEATPDTTPTDSAADGVMARVMAYREIKNQIQQARDN